MEDPKNMDHDNLRTIFECWPVDEPKYCENYNKHFNNNGARVIRDVMLKYPDNEDAREDALSFRQEFGSEITVFCPIQQIEANAQLEHIHPRNKYEQHKHWHDFCIVC